MRGKPLTVIGLVKLADGSVKRLEELSGEETQRLKASCRERGQRVMTDYYKRHPNEFLLLPKAENYT